MRVGLSPRYSPTPTLGRLIVGNQAPEYVAAEPRRLAWTIGVALSATMFVLMVLMNSCGPISGVICLVCLLFPFFEAASPVRGGGEALPRAASGPPPIRPRAASSIVSRQDVRNNVR